MSHAKRITKTAVDALRPGEKLWDLDVRGFGVRCQRRDMVYVLKYRAAGGRQRWYTIGRHGSPWTVEQARKAARVALGTVAQGRDPQGEREAARVRLEGLTVAQAIELFMERHGRRLRTAREFNRCFV